MNEAQWKAELRKRFDRIGVSLSLHGHMMQAPGWPDLYIASHPFNGWIELKARHGELSDAQRRVGRKLTQFGRNFAVVRASEDWKSYRLETWNSEHWSVLMEDTGNPIDMLKAIAEFCSEDPL